MNNKTVFPTTPPKPTSRRTLWIVVAVVVVIVVVATALVIALNHGGTTTNRPVPTTPTASAPPTSSGTPDDSGFTGTTVDKLNKPVQLPANPAGQLLPQTAKTPAGQDDAPAGLTWEKLYDLPIVPFSTSDGPTTIKDGVVQGWAHTAQGAALAGISILSIWLGGPDSVAAVAQRSLVSGDAAVVAARAATDRQARGAALRNPALAPTTVAGTQIRSYSDTFAQIDYGAGPFASDDETNGAYTVTTLSVTWEDNTWKLIVTPTNPGRGEERPTIAGMSSWSE